MKEERFDRNIKMFNEIVLEIRNKAIDEFAKSLKERWIETDDLNLSSEFFKFVDKVEEQMKEFKALKEDSRFLKFLYDSILPNEMERYLSMYKSSDIKTAGE